MKSSRRMNLDALRSTSHVKVIAQRFMLCFDHQLQKFADGKEGRKVVRMMLK
jgi:hypothetical protein